jgi:hypothetical protein
VAIIARPRGTETVHDEEYCFVRVDGRRLMEANPVTIRTRTSS